MYFVVQKVACSSVKSALLPLFDFGVGGSELTRRDGTTAVHQLFADSPYELTGADFTSELATGRYDGYFKFAFVRNLWDRLVSCYLQKLGPGRRSRASIGRKHSGGKLREDMHFREFARAVCEICDSEANPHFRLQHVVLYGGTDSLLPSFIDRFENLEEDFARVAAEIGAQDLKLPHLTPSLARDNPSYRDFYDEREAKMVSERFQRDISNSSIILSSLCARCARCA